MYDAKRMVHYYQAIHKRHHRADRLTLWLIAMSGTSAAASLWVQTIPKVCQPLATFGLAAVSLWVLLAGYAAKSATALSIARDSGGIESELAELYAKVHDPANSAAIEDSAVRAQLRGLKTQLSEISYRAGDSGLTTIKRINIKASRDARKVLKDEYG